MGPELFAKYDEAQLFEALIDVFHAKIVVNPRLRSLTWQELVVGLRDRIDVTKWNPQVQDQFEAVQGHRPQVVHFPDHMKLSGAAWRFVSQNLAYPQLAGSSEHRLHILTLTELGHQVCSKKPEDNPSRPGHLERLRTANPKIEEEVFERLIDASACLAAGLHRPAIVMLGIAAEVTTSWAYKAMKKIVLITTNKPVEFKDQVAAVQGQIDNVPTLSSDQKHRLKMAFDSIESLRVLRNNAAHHGNPSPDPFVAEDRFGSSCFHLPVVWTELILPIQP